VAIFGRRNVISDAQYVVIVGGGTGTRAEADLASAVGKRVVPYRASGGTAQAVLQQLRRHPASNSWIPSEALATLDRCGHRESGTTAAKIEQMTDDFVDMLDNLIHANRGESRV
jgi:hypothetical protein